MKLDNICKSYNSKLVLDNLCLEIKTNSIVCITGASGCGKTTLLNIVAGLEKQDSGTVFIPEGKVSYLFQEPRLLEGVSVLDNVSVVLNGEVEKAKRMLEKMKLGDCLYKKPSFLSGGQRQRVSIARAFVYPSHVILLDEPFQNLDEMMHLNLVEEFLSLWNANKKTVLWVTHNLSEAKMVSDKIFNMKDGRLYEYKC